MSKAGNSIFAKLFSDVTTIPKSLSASYYPSIDGLRAFAILHVIAAHALTFKQVNIAIDYSLGVHTFFLISGFLITTLLLKEKVKYGRVSFKNFYIRRALRILPVAYLYFFALIILNLFFHFGLPFKALLTSVLYLNNFPLPTTLETHHFWTLATEEQFYLIAPLLLITNLNRYIKLIFFLLLFIPFINYVGFNNVGVFYSNKIIHNITYLLISLLDYGTQYILVGSLFAILVFKRVLVIERLPKNYYLSTILFVAAILEHAAPGLPVLRYLNAIVFSVLMGLVIVMNLSGQSLLSKMLSSRLFVNIGLISYSLYIWQQIFVVRPPWIGTFKYSDSLWLNVPALFLVAFCSYYFYEARFLKLKSRFKAK